MEINLREWRRADLVEIQRAWLTFCRSALRSDMRLRPNAERTMKDWLSQRFKDHSSLGIVAEQRSECVAFLIGRIDVWESTPPIIEPRRIGIIDALYVDESHRKQGVGVRLVNRAVEIMRAKDVVVADAVYEASSDAAVKTWCAAGFTPWVVHARRML